MMKERSLVRLAVFWLAASAVVLTGCGGSSGDGVTGGGTLPAIGGSWTGTWTDTRYNVSGGLTAVFTLDGSTVTATGTIDLSALGLGTRAGTGSGSITGETLTFSFSAAAVGNGQGTLAGTAAEGSGTVTGVLGFGDFTFSGTATDTTISGTFDFTSPTGGNGVVTLARQ